MAKAAPHHLELIYQLLVQGTHFWVHQLLVHGQADSEDVDLRTKNRHHWTKFESGSYFFTEQLGLEDRVGVAFQDVAASSVTISAQNVNKINLGSRSFWRRGYRQMS